MFPKIVGFPQIHPISIGVSIWNHPFWGFSPYFWKHPTALPQLLFGDECPSSETGDEFRDGDWQLGEWEGEWLTYPLRYLTSYQKWRPYIIKGLWTSLVSLKKALATSWWRGTWPHRDRGRRSWSLWGKGIAWPRMSFWPWCFRFSFQNCKLVGWLVGCLFICLLWRTSRRIFVFSP